MERRLARLLRVLLVDGPRQIEPHDRSVWDALFPWPVRLVIVFGAWAVGSVFGETPAGIQLGWGLQYGLFIAIAIVASFWSLLLVLNTALAALWVYLTKTRLAPKLGADQKPEWDLLDFVTWLNRQVAHIEVLATYVAIAFVLTPRLVYQLPLLATVLALGGPIVDGITQLNRFGGVEARSSRTVLLRQRRLLIYLLSAAGLLFLSTWAPEQFWVFAPLLVTAAPGLALRTWRFMTRRGQMRDPNIAPLMGGDDQTQALVLHQRVQAFSRQRAELQQHAAPWFAPACALAVVGVAVGFVAWQSERVAKAASDERDGPPAPEDTCAREPGGPISPPITMFVVADSQLHELGGTRFPGQMEVASTVVPVARRPIELDVLSAAAVIRFGAVYDQISAAAGKDSRPLWAHLGDFADLSCSREMDRMIALLDRYGGRGSRRLAGVAPGNHDSAFTGNFDWNPYWTPACTDKDPRPPTAEFPGPVYSRLDKTLSDTAIEKLLVDHIAPGGSTGVVRGSFVDGLWRASPAVWGNPTARYTVTPLGVLSGGGGDRRRGVVGIFIDTADRLAHDYGVAGRYGTFSSKQAKAIAQAVAALKSQSGADYADPWYVVFGHSPYNELTGASREALDGLLASLDVRSDRCEPADDLCNGPRTLALVTAHTHHAEAHRHCVNGRLLRELVVGSVIDPPQQAAKLEIGLDARGRAAVRLSTLPAVSREGRTCEPQLGLSASLCHRAVAALRGAKECLDLVDGPDAGQGRGKSCEELEERLTLDEQVTGLVRHGGPREPERIMEVETKRARALLRCLCRDDPGRNIKAPAACRDREPPLHGERYAAVVEALAGTPARADEVACLAWAAASIQEHKANGMTMADALRCAFDDPTLPAARVVVATSDDEVCP